MPVPQLTSIGNVKAILPSAATADDGLLSRLVFAVSAWWETATNRTYASQSYVETRNGNRRRSIGFLQVPATAVTSVVIDGQSIPARSQVGAAGYTFDQNFLYLEGYGFGCGKQSVVLTYTAGFVVTPFDVEQAVITLSALAYKNRGDRLGVTGQGIGPEHISYLVGKIPPDVQLTLDQWTRRLIPAP